MHILDVDIMRVIRWQVDPAPPDVAWSPSGTIGILNPLIHQGVRRRQSPDMKAPYILFNSNRGVLITDAIGIVVGGKLSRDYKTEWALEKIPLLISCLRSASGQPITESEGMSFGEITLEDLPHADLPDRSSAKQIAAPATIREWAITPEDVELALQYFESGGPPAPRTMLVDALHAYVSHDHKKTIVYASIAMETVAATVLDNEFQEVLTRVPQSSEWRVIKMPQAGGPVVKDPVFDVLRDPRAPFRHLLHELPLYVRARSLLLEKETLYAEALRVYKTRNEIVHHAEPRDQDSVAALTIDREGARTSVQCALNVCHWFGEGLRFGLHDREGLIYDQVPANTPSAPSE